MRRRGIGSRGLLPARGLGEGGGEIGALGALFLWGCVDGGGAKDVLWVVLAALVGGGCGFPVVIAQIPTCCRPALAPPAECCPHTSPASPDSAHAQA